MDDRTGATASSSGSRGTLSSNTDNAPHPLSPTHGLAAGRGGNSAGYFDLPHTSGSRSRAVYGADGGRGHAGVSAHTTHTAHASHAKRTHAASISSLRYTAPSGRATQADLLGTVNGGTPRNGFVSDMRPSRSGSGGEASRSQQRTPGSPGDPRVPDHLSTKSRRQSGDTPDRRASASSSFLDAGMAARDLSDPYTHTARNSLNALHPPLPYEAREYVDSLSKEDAAVLEMQFDAMSDEELGMYLGTLFPLPGLGGTFGGGTEEEGFVLQTPRGEPAGEGSRRGGSSGGHGREGPGGPSRREAINSASSEDDQMRTPGATSHIGVSSRTSSQDDSYVSVSDHSIDPTPHISHISQTSPHSPSSSTSPTSPTYPASPTPRPILPRQRSSSLFEDDKSPLFPPSPPGGRMLCKADHPLRVLSRAVRELQENVRALQLENERLQREVEVGRAVKAKGKGADEVSRPC